MVSRTGRPAQRTTTKEAAKENYEVDKKQEHTKTNKPPTTLQEAFNRYIAWALPTIPVVCFFLYLFISLSHVALLKGHVKLMLTSVSVTSALWYAFAWFWLRKHTVTNVPLWIFLFWFPLWCNSQFHIGLTGEIHQTTNLFSTLVAAGLFVVWRRWFIAATVILSVGWLQHAIFLYAHPLFIHYTFSFVFFFALTWTIHVTQEAMVKSSWESQQYTLQQNASLAKTMEDLQQEQKEKDTAFQALHSYSTMQKEILDHAPILVCIFNPEGQLQHVEGQAAALLREETPFEEEPWQSSTQLMPLMPMLLKAKRGTEAEEGIIHLFGRIWSGRLRAQSNDAGETTSLIAVLYDVTEHYKSQQARDQFVSMVSHELRTPLTAINGALQLVSHIDTMKPAQREQMLSLMQRNTTRLHKIIDDLLDFNKMKAGQLRFVLEDKELQNLLQLTIEMLSPFADQRKVYVELRDIDGPLYVRVDEQRMQQVVANLLSNAIKFSPEGATIKVDIDATETHVMIFVRDEGPGVSEEMQEKIFEPFVQEESDGAYRKGGTGLGLSLARQFIHQMEGTLGYIAEEGAGACFVLRLPRLRRR